MRFLAEDLAILDNLTEGRVEVGFGRGIRGYESIFPKRRLERRNRGLSRLCGTVAVPTGGRDRSDDAPAAGHVAVPSPGLRSMTR